VAVSVTLAPVAKLEEHPLRATPFAMVQLIPAGLLLTVPVPLPAPVTVSVNAPSVKLAVAVAGALTANWQEPAPEHGPAQPVNPLFGFGVTVSVRLVPCGKLALHPVTAATPAVMTQPLMPAGVLLTVPLPLPPPAIVTGCSTTVPKPAVTCLFESSGGKVQVPNPLHAPPQPVKLLAPLGVAVRVTTVFGAKLKVQVPSELPFSIEQLMPAGTLVIVPLPVPLEGPTLTLKVWGAKAAVTARLPFIVSAQDPVPVQEPLQPVNDWLPPGVAVRPTAIPAGKLAWQVPPVAPPLVMVQLMPAGELVTVPLPEPPPLTVTGNVSWLNDAVTGFAASATS